MLYLRRDDYHIARMELLGGLAPLLIPAPAFGTQQDLPAARLGVVNMPVVPTSRLKGDIGHRDTLGSEHIQIALADEKLSKGVSLSTGEEIMDLQHSKVPPFSVNNRSMQVFPATGQ